MFSAGGVPAAGPPALVVAPRTGQALLFRHALWHEGTPVLRGCKYVLRSDVLYAAPGGAALSQSRP